MTDSFARVLEAARKEREQLVGQRAGTVSTVVPRGTVLRFQSYRCPCGSRYFQASPVGLPWTSDDRRFLRTMRIAP